MRWDNLFDDLESQLEQELSAEEIDLQAEEERLRLARLGIRDRLRSLHAAVEPASGPAVAPTKAPTDERMLHLAHNCGAGNVRTGLARRRTHRGVGPTAAVHRSA
jgi:hypothetical protein